MYELINDKVSREVFAVPCKTKKKKSLRKTISDYVAAENQNLLPERRISLKSAFIVAERSLTRTKDKDDSTRRFLAVKEVSAYVRLCITGKGEANFDLLPVGHPLSTRSHRMSEFALRNERANWIAADPRIDDSARELVLSAYQQPIGTLEYIHAVTRLSALTAGLVPREVVLTALTAAFSFGDGNSSAARSLRAKLQWRDRIGRWIEMGRGVNFKVKLPNGLVATARGKFVGQGKGGGNVGLVQVKGNKDLPDGIYPVDGSNASAFKALLPESAVKGMKAGKLSQILDRRAKILTLDEVKAMRQDAPDGWTKNSDGSFSSDDDYIVEEKDGKLSLFRKDKDGNKAGQVGESVDDWAQVQDLANNDQESYDEFKRIASIPENKDAIPGTEIDTQSPATKEALAKLKADRAAKEKADIEFKMSQNEKLDKFEEAVNRGEDLLGRKIPDGWMPRMRGDVVDTEGFVKYQDGVELVANLNSSSDKIMVGTPSEWFGEVDSWDAAEELSKDVVNKTFASDRYMITNPLSYSSAKAKADKWFAGDPSFIEDVKNADNPLSREEIEARLQSNEAFMSDFKKGDPTAQQLVKDVRVRGNSMPYGKAKFDDDAVSLDDVEKLHQKITPGTRWSNTAKPFESNGLVFSREQAYIATNYPDVAVFDGDKKILDITPNGNKRWAEGVNPKDYESNLKKAIASLDAPKEDYDDSATQLTKEERDAFVKGMASPEFDEREGLQFMRQDPIYAAMSEEVEVYDGYDGAPDAGPQVPVATIFEDGAVEWRDKEAFDKYGDAFIKATKSGEKVQWIEEPEDGGTPKTPTLIEDEREKVIDFKKEKSDGGDGDGGGKDDGILSNTPGGGFADYVIDLAEGDRFLDKDLEARMDDEDAADLGRDLMDEIYEDASSRYPLEQDIADNKPEDMSKEQFVEDAAVRMRKLLSDIVDSAYDERRFLEEDQDLEIDFDKDAFVEAGVERFKELVAEEIDNMDDDGDDEGGDGGGGDTGPTPSGSPTQDEVLNWIKEFPEGVQDSYYDAPTLVERNNADDFPPIDKEELRRQLEAFEKRFKPKPIKKKTGPFKNIDKFKELAGVQTLKVKGPDGKEVDTPVVNIAGRPMVLVNVNGVRVPFYISTGSGGKLNVAVGQWYPIFGIGADGWFNKGTEEEINDFYGSPELKEVADWLNANIGDIRNENLVTFDDISSDVNNDVREQMNADLTPGMYYQNGIHYVNRQLALAKIKGDKAEIAELEQELDNRVAEMVKNQQAQKVEEQKVEVPEPAPEAEGGTPQFDVPPGAFKLNVGGFEPEGRYDDEMSPDYTDDPAKLANKFTEGELMDALAQAVIGREDYVAALLEDDDDEDAPKKKGAAKQLAASGSGSLEFKQGEEWVPAEAIYLALKEQGVDVDLALAELYDSVSGESKNKDLIEQARKGETVEAQSPTPLLDDLDLYDADNLARVNVQLAQVEASGGVMAELEELSMKKGEPNPEIDRIAQDIVDRNYYADLLRENFALAYSDDPNERQAFRGLWAAILSLDGGITTAKDAENTDLYDTLKEAYSNHFGVPADENDIANFFKEQGNFVDLFQSRLNLTNGTESLNDPDSFAGSWFRLVAATSRYNQKSLHRGIMVPDDPEFLDKFVAGNILSFDARPFSTDPNIAAMFAGFAGKPNGTVGVIFDIPALKGKAADMSSLSPFTDELEMQAWGNYKITNVRESVNANGKKFLHVTVERLDKRGAVLNGFDSDYAPLLMKENNSPDMPEGYHVVDTAAYTPDPSRDFPEGFEDSPLALAREYDKEDLALAFRDSIENGTGEVELQLDEDNTISVPTEMVRDALQIQGVDTNALLDDIANAEPGVEPSDAEESEPVELAEVDENDNAELVDTFGSEYDIEGWKQVGPQLGSNKGGFYEDAEGNRFYVKEPKSDLHAENEILAAALYRKLGIDAAEIKKGSGEDGKVKTFSPDIEGDATLRDALNDPDVIKKIQEGFAVDAWLANWDVAGLDFDNVMLDGEGNPVRVDPGGALLFRAMGAPKGSLFGNEVNELDTLRDPKMNPQSAEIFGTMTPEEQKESARKLLDISNDDIDELVDGIVSDPSSASQLKDTLKARRQYILEKYDLLGDDGSTLVQNSEIEDEPSAEEVLTPEGFKSEVDQALDTAGGWAQEYAEDENILSSQRKAFQKISDQIDMMLVQWREGKISDEELPDKIQEVRDFIDTFDFGDITDDDVLALNHADDVDEQLRVLQELAEENVKKNKPEETTPEVTPLAEETPVEDEGPKPTAPGEDNPAYKDGNGNVIRNNKGDVYIYRKKGQPDVEVTFSRYDPANTGYVYMYMGDGKKPKAISTKKIFKKEDGGGDTGPKVDEAPSAPQPETPEAPTPTPEPVKEAGQLRKYADTLERQLVKTTDVIQELRGDYKNIENVQKELDAVENSLGPVWSHLAKMQERMDEEWDEDTVTDSIKAEGRAALVEVQALVEKYGNVKINNAMSELKNVLEAQMKEWDVDTTPPPTEGDIIDQEQQAPAQDLVPPAGVLSAPGADGKLIFSGVVAKTKAGATVTVLKVNKDNYAYVQQEDGTYGWRSAKTLTSTGVIENVAKPSTKPTGAGVPPIKVSTPANWSESSFEDLPSLTAAMQKVMDTSDPANAMRGASAAVDSDSIEDLDVRLLHVKDKDGTDGIRLKFKLTNWAGNKRVADLRKMYDGMTPEEREAAGVSLWNQMEVEKLVIDPDGTGRIVSDEGYQDSFGVTWEIPIKDSGIVVRIHRANKDASSNVKPRTDYAIGGPLAFHNMVTVQAPADATPEQLAEALKIAGVEDVRPATSEDAKVLIENRLMSIFDRQTDARTNLKGEDREKSLERIKDKWGVTVDDVVITAGASGRLETRLSEEGARKIWEATGRPRAIHHSITSNIADYHQDRDKAFDEAADWLVNMFSGPQGGLLSTTSRWTEGIGTQGMSSEEDIQTGGADYVFTTPSKASAIDYGTQGMFPYIFFDPIKMFQRLDFYANSYDGYGERSAKQDVISAAQMGVTQEIMFKGRVGWEDLDSVIVSEEMMPRIMKRFEDKGITQIGGRPLDQIFILKRETTP